MSRLIEEYENIEKVLNIQRASLSYLKSLPTDDSLSERDLEISELQVEIREKQKCLHELYKEMKDDGEIS